MGKGSVQAVNGLSRVSGREGDGDVNLAASRCWSSCFGSWYSTSHLNLGVHSYGHRVED